MALLSESVRDEVCVSEPRAKISELGDLLPLLMLMMFLTIDSPWVGRGRLGRGSSLLVGIGVATALIRSTSLEMSALRLECVDASTRALEKAMKGPGVASDSSADAERSLHTADFVAHCQRPIRF
jgi:hypothetical protein